MRRPAGGSIALPDDKYRQKLRRSIEHLRTSTGITGGYRGQTRSTSARRAAASEHGDGRTGGGGSQVTSSSTARALTDHRSRLSARLRGEHSGFKLPGGAAWLTENSRTAYRTGALQANDEREKVAPRRGFKRGRLLLIIDVQSRQGAVEEVFVREGDNAFVLAKGFILRHGLDLRHVHTIGVHIQEKVRQTGFAVDIEGRCWQSSPEVHSLTCAPTGGPEDAHHLLSSRPAFEKTRQSAHERQTSDVALRRGENRGPCPHPTGTDRATSGPKATVHNARSSDLGAMGDVQWAAQWTPKVHRVRGCEGVVDGEGTGVVDATLPMWPHDYRKRSGSRSDGEDERLGPHGFSRGDGDRTRAHAYADDNSRPPRVAAERGNISQALEECGIGFDREETPPPAIVDAGEAHLQAHASQSVPTAGSRGRSWSRLDGPGQWQALNMNPAGESHSWGSTSSPVLLESSVKGGRATSPLRRGPVRSPLSEYSEAFTGENMVRTHAEESLHHRNTRPWGGRWRQDEEVRGWQSAPDETNRMRARRHVSIGGTNWRTRGAKGRTVNSREALRQSQVSDRLHRQGEVMARKREVTRRRRDDLLDARASMACSGRLSLCAKTRQLTANLPKYKYEREQRDRIEEQAGAGRRVWKSAEDRRYRDAGDRLYSEWNAGRETRSKHRDAKMARQAWSRETWSCPKCGACNRSQDDTCKTVTGMAVPAQELRPDTWCRESAEKLGKMAVEAAVGGNTGRKKHADNDGLRRCGTRRPPLFVPTAVAKRREDAVRPRATGEMLFDELYRNPPTPQRRRAKQILDAETKCTFTPEINRASVRLAEAREARSRAMASCNHAEGGSLAGEGSTRSDRDGTCSARSDTFSGGDHVGGSRRTITPRVPSPSRPVAKSLQLYGEYAGIERRKEQRREELLSQLCTFTPDIGISAAWPAQDASTDEFFRRLHDEHEQQQRRLDAKRQVLYQNASSAVDAATGRPLFCPFINNNKHRRPSTPVSGDQGAAGKAQQSWMGRWRLNAGEGHRHQGGGGHEASRHTWRGSVHERLWEQAVALERRREVTARGRDETMKAIASEGHVGVRSAGILRGTRVRSLMQMYRTLLASVEYARLPEGLEYHEAMESITEKIKAIYDNENDAWQDMPLEVAKADPSVLKPELVGIVTAALAGHSGETLGLADFCELLDASVQSLATIGGPTAHLFAAGSGAGVGTAAAVEAAATRAERKEADERKEMTFRPKIDKNSAAIARNMGRDGSKGFEDVLRREASKQDRRRRALVRQRDDMVRRECTFVPDRRHSERTGPRPRYANERAEDERAAREADAAAAAAAVAAASAASVAATPGGASASMTADRNIQEHGAGHVATERLDPGLAAVTALAAAAAAADEEGTSPKGDVDYEA